MHRSNGMMAGVCKAKSEGGRRCPCSGGKRPNPTSKAEKAQLAQDVQRRRAENRRSAAHYRENQERQADQAQQWCDGRDDGEIAARLSEIQDIRGLAAERRVLTDALNNASEQGLSCPPQPSAQDIVGDDTLWDAAVAKYAGSGDDFLQQKSLEWGVLPDDLLGVCLRRLRKRPDLIEEDGLEEVLSNPLDYLDLWECRDAARAVGKRRAASEVKRQRAERDDPLAVAQGLPVRAKSELAKVHDDTLYLAVGNHDDAERCSRYGDVLVETGDGIALTSKPPKVGTKRHTAVKVGKRWAAAGNLQREVLSVTPVTVFDGETIYRVDMGAHENVE